MDTTFYKFGIKVMERDVATVDYPTQYHIHSLYPIECLMVTSPNYKTITHKDSGNINSIPWCIQSFKPAYEIFTLIATPEPLAWMPELRATFHNRSKAIITPPKRFNRSIQAQSWLELIPWAPSSQGPPSNVTLDSGIWDNCSGSELLNNAKAVRAWWLRSNFSGVPELFFLHISFYRMDKLFTVQ